ncbi:MAG: DUF58 domain-containing protein [Fimbriimonadaceae bacterium]|nr:DUF58 domain-containing protein [Fimbriimonadaceae bacterium]QYK59375.1 MAG: DUF58 domain-containing protein [Fimbriimonadaceae bacterium]
MNRYATIALTVASLFLMVMAVLVNSAALFIMTVAVIATLGGSRLQAWLAVRGLRIERSLPPAVSLGDLTTAEFVVWSERRLKRPLVVIEDDFPPRFRVSDMTPTLPVAPAFDQPIRTKYTFRPMRRGRYRWHRATVFGTDALGLVRLEKSYEANPVELTVYPVALPLPIELRAAAGWGTSELDTGSVRGAGLEPRGIREYVHGDPLRHVHWRSSARLGRLMVKEFDTGSGVSLAFFLQRTQGTEFGIDQLSTFEAMCGHALYLAEDALDRGANLWFPAWEPRENQLAHPEARKRTVREVLTDASAESSSRVVNDLEAAGLRSGQTAVVFLAVEDPGLTDWIHQHADVRTIVLIYDVDHYQGASLRPRSVLRAADPDSIARLERAGAQVHITPKVDPILL